MDFRKDNISNISLMKTFNMGYDILEISIEKELNKLDTSIHDLFTPPLKWREITTFISAAVSLAERLFPEQGSGGSKLAFVMEVWDHYDKKYHLVDALDNLIDFRKILGIAFGTIVERFDSGVIRAIVEKIIIPLMVSKLFPHIG